jgi:hypothetical protein
MLQYSPFNPGFCPYFPSYVISFLATPELGHVALPLLRPRRCIAEPLGVELCEGMTWRQQPIKVDVTVGNLKMMEETSFNYPLVS